MSSESLATMTRGLNELYVDETRLIHKLDLIVKKVSNRTFSFVQINNTRTTSFPPLLAGIAQIWVSDNRLHVYKDAKMIGVLDKDDIYGAAVLISLWDRF